MLPSPYGCRLGPRGYSLSRPQCVHCCYGPVTRGLPWGGLVDRLQSFSFHHLCYPNYGALTLTPAGLSPAEHASLRWTHNRDLNISQTAYGLGAGIFFLSYFIFEVPSNLFLERFGARKWIARIMLSWGILSGIMATIPNLAAWLGMRNEHVFYGLRMALGIAEAGFFPGIIFYLTLWFPAVYRARIIGYFMAAIPLSTVIGAPVSGLLLGMDGHMGLKGWQWLFMLEAVPALVLSVVVFFYLTDRPADADWLAPD